MDVWVASNEYLLEYQGETITGSPTDGRYQTPSLTIFKGETFEFYVTAFDGDDCTELGMYIVDTPFQEEVYSPSGNGDGYVQVEETSATFDNLE